MLLIAFDAFATRLLGAVQQMDASTDFAMGSEFCWVLRGLLKSYSAYSLHTGGYSRTCIGWVTQHACIRETPDSVRASATSFRSGSLGMWLLCCNLLKG